MLITVPAIPIWMKEAVEAAAKTGKKDNFTSRFQGAILGSSVLHGGHVARIYLPRKMESPAILSRSSLFNTANSMVDRQPQPEFSVKVRSPSTALKEYVPPSGDPNPTLHVGRVSNLARAMGGVNVENNLASLIGHRASRGFIRGLSPLATAGQVAGIAGAVGLEGDNALNAALGGAALSLPKIVHELAASHSGGRHLARLRGGSGMYRFKNYARPYARVPGHLLSALAPLAALASRKAQQRLTDEFDKTQNR